MNHGGDDNGDEKGSKTTVKEKPHKKIYSSSSNQHQLPPVSTWKHAPMFFHADPNVVTLPDQTKCTGQQCPIGIPFEFETDLFKVGYYHSSATKRII